MITYLDQTWTNGPFYPVIWLIKSYYIEHFGGDPSIGRFRSFSQNVLLYRLNPGQRMAVHYRDKYDLLNNLSKNVIDHIGLQRLKESILEAEYVWISKHWE